MLKLLLFLVIVLFTFSFNNTYSQSGSITGKIVDASTGESIIGANVLVDKSTFGAATDLDGNYTIKGIPAGKVDLVVSFISYTKTTIKEINIEAGKTQTINISLKSEAIDIGGEVLVVGEVTNQYEAALLNQRKKSVQISDGISAEQIKRSTDGTTAETLRRVPGLTLMNNKYIFVRGVSERYNGALLNNSPLASSEPDKKDFAFDLIPSNLIENTVVVKSFTPDEPGDFAGGLVKINTVEFPSNTIFSFSYSTSYVDKVTSKNITMYEGSSTDYLGFDNGFRDLPEGFPDPVTYAGYASTDSAVQYWSTKVNDKWKPLNKKAFLDQSFGITYGDRFNILENDFGIIGSFTYKSSTNAQELISKDLANIIDTSYFFDYSGNGYSRNIYSGGILNVAYKIGDFHKIGFKNSYTVNTDDNVSSLKGYYEYWGEDRITTAYRFVSRKLYAGQLFGSSYFPFLSGVHLDWRMSYSSSFRDEPDYRRYVYHDKDPFDDEAKFNAFIPNLPDPFSSGRYYSYLDEYKRGIGIDLSQTFADLKVKYGIFHSTSNRYFNSRNLGVIDAYGRGTSEQYLSNYAIDSVFSTKNFELRYLAYKEFFNWSDIYSSSDNLFSYYLMTELPFSFFDQNFELITGARVENFVQRISTYEDSRSVQVKIPLNISNFKSNILPAFSLIYRMSEASNIRLSFSRTINRPQFREIAPFNYYTFEDQTLTKGNPKLKQATIANYDLRFETFPGIGELISVSVFLKEFRNPIEKIYVVSTGNRDRTFANASFARNSGLEFEYRTSLGILWEELTNFNLTANYSRIWSEISETNVGTGRKTRPMQGQSPYVINLSLAYQNNSLGLSANVSYNRFGKRIIETATLAGDDIYEFPRDMLDIVISKNIGDHLEFKLSLKDMLAQPIEFFEEEILVRKYTTNAKLSLGVSYKL